MTGAELIKWIEENHAEELPVYRHVLEEDYCKTKVVDVSVEGTEKKKIVIN